MPSTVSVPLSKRMPRLPAVCTIQLLVQERSGKESTDKAMAKHEGGGQKDAGPGSPTIHLKLPNPRECADQAYDTDTWRKLSIYIVIPSIIIAGVNAWRLWNEHWEHKAHDPPLEEKTEYAFQNIRTKNYFWGDGDKVRA